jgi:hypothetical protein
MAMQDINVQVRQIAQAERARALQKKNPAKPADAAQPKPEAPKP